MDRHQHSHERPSPRVGTPALSKPPTLHQHSGREFRDTAALGRGEAEGPRRGAFQCQQHS